MRLVGENAVDEPWTTGMAGRLRADAYNMATLHAHLVHDLLPTGLPGLPGCSLLIHRIHSSYHYQDPSLKRKKIEERGKGTNEGGGRL
jgi:hypothetical protein